MTVSVQDDRTKLKEENVSKSVIQLESLSLLY